MGLSFHNIKARGPDQQTILNETSGSDILLSLDAKKDKSVG